MAVPKVKSYCALFDKNYLNRLLVLYKSLLRHSSDPFEFHLLPMDDEAMKAFIEFKNEDGARLYLYSLGGLEIWFGLDSDKSKRTWQEYCWMMASQFMLALYSHAYDGTITESLTYLDADLMFFSDPQAIFDEIGNRSIGIIPHRFNKRDEARLIQNGKFNVSWVTIKNTPTGRACIERWAKQCRDWCYYRNEDGKFGDQKYLDEWTDLYPGEVCEISNPGAGLAPWNIARYDFIQNGNGLRIYRDRQTGLNYHCPVVFYHYHEFQQREDGSYRLTNYPLSQSDKDLIYAPYIEALKAVEAIHIPA